MHDVLVYAANLGIRLLIALMAVGLLVGCGTPTTPPMKRYVDSEAGVICYYFLGSSTAMSCLPLSQTKLDK